MSRKIDRDWRQARDAAATLKSKLPGDVATLSIHHLQLRAGLSAQIKVRTIGELLEYIATSDSGPAGWTTTLRREILRILGLFDDVVRTRGFLCWDTFRKNRPANTTSGQLWFASPCVSSLPRKIRQGRLGQLNFRL